MTRRGLIAIVVLLGWAGGMLMFLRRELVRGPARRLADAGLRVAPGAVFYSVELHGAQIGYASSTIDTVPGGGLRVADFLLADVPVASRVRRTRAQSVARLTRALALTDFSLAFDSDSATLRVRGRVQGDSVVELALSRGGVVVDSRRVRLSAPMLLPTLLPLAVALGERATVGHGYELSAFDAGSLAPHPVRVTIVAESLLTVPDSAAFDSTARAWRVAHRDTVRSWLMATDAPRGVRGWVDEQGRIVRATNLFGFDLSRTAYELAFERWRRARRDTLPASRPPIAHRP